MKILPQIALLATLGAAALPGCHLKNSFSSDAPSVAALSANDPAVPAPMPESPFEISTKSTQKDADPIELSIEVKNATSETIELNFTSGQKFDFSATREGETDAVWSYGMNKRFIQSLSTVALEPGKSVHFETSWKDARPGKYTVRALVKANGGLNASPFEITVK